MHTSAPVLGEPLPVELMNTIWADRDGVHDALAEENGGEAWLHAVAPRIELMATADLDALAVGEVNRLGERLRRLRDALRRLAAEITRDPRPAAASSVSELDNAVAEVNQSAAAVPRWSALTWTSGSTPCRVTRTSGQVSAAAVSAIAEEAIDLFAHPDRQRLRACLAPGCVLYFIKNHPRREWCSAGCGNRARSARHYQRHRGSNP